jgi:hypothetical protein
MVRVKVRASVRVTTEASFALRLSPVSSSLANCCPNTKPGRVKAGRRTRKTLMAETT